MLIFFNVFSFNYSHATVLCAPNNVKVTTRAAIYQGTYTYQRYNAAFYDWKIRRNWNLNFSKNPDKQMAQKFYDKVREIRLAEKAKGKESKYYDRLYIKLEAKQVPYPKEAAHRCTQYGCDCSKPVGYLDVEKILIMRAQ